jgi:hypothetical protein
MEGFYDTVVAIRKDVMSQYIKLSIRLDRPPKDSETIPIMESIHSKYIDVLTPYKITHIVKEALSQLFHYELNGPDQ